MAESNQSRTAYLVVTHPDTGAVKDVLTITQSQSAQAPTSATTLATIATNATTQATSQPFYFRTATPCGGGSMKTIRRSISFGSMVSCLVNDGTSTVWEFNSSEFVGTSSTSFDYSYDSPGLCGSGGGGGGGCILAGEMILMEDGTSKKVEDVVVGDRVKGIALPGLSLEEDSWKTWSSNDVDFTSSNTVTEVKSIQAEVFNTAFNLVFNTGSLKVTGEHPVLTKREDGSVLFMPVRDLLAGDSVRYFPSNSWQTLTSIETLENNALMSYNLDAEAVDNYVAGGVIVHNTADLEKDDGYGGDSEGGDMF